MRKRVVFLATSIVFASLSSIPVSAMPDGLNGECQALYQQYVEKGLPKAFATSNNSRCSYAYGMGSMRKSKTKAIEYCRDAGGVSCKVVETEGK
jgi:hypothetical protein